MFVNLHISRDNNVILITQNFTLFNLIWKKKYFQSIHPIISSDKKSKPGIFSRSHRHLRAPPLLLTHCYSNIEMPGSSRIAQANAITCIRGVRMPSNPRIADISAQGYTAQCAISGSVVRASVYASNRVTCAREIYTGDDYSRISIVSW